MIQIDGAVALDLPTRLPRPGVPSGDGQARGRGNWRSRCQAGALPRSATRSSLAYQPWNCGSEPERAADVVMKPATLAVEAVDQHGGLAKPNSVTLRASIGPVSTVRVGSTVSSGPAPKLILAGVVAVSIGDPEDMGGMAVHQPFEAVAILRQPRARGPPAPAARQRWRRRWCARRYRPATEDNSCLARKWLMPSRPPGARDAARNIGGAGAFQENQGAAAIAVLDAAGRRKGANSDAEGLEATSYWIMAR